MQKFAKYYPETADNCILRSLALFSLWKSSDLLNGSNAEPADIILSA
ncbi:MAG TPA: hypothetical protein VGE26_12065 [Sphingobacteriaceae bacterium]